MNDRIHKYLDGAPTFEKLSPDDRGELDAHEAIIRHVKQMRRVEPTPDLADAVMRRLSERVPATMVETADPPRGVGSLVAWLWRPRPVRLRPAWGLALAATLATVWLTSPSDDVPSGPTPTVAVLEAPAQVFVQFRLDAPGASMVRLAGSFTEWEPRHVLHESAPGVWTILIPLAPGVHEYSFVVDDGEWRPDPGAPRIDDGFGGENSRVAVLLPST